MGRFQRFINFVERVGNKLPHPFMLFVSLAIIVLIISFVCNKLGVSVTYMTASKNAAETTKEVTVTVRNLLEADYIRSFLTDFVDTYVSFPPLGLIMIMMLGIGYLQDTGFFNALMRKTLLGAPAYTVTFVLAVVGVCANIASNAGIVFAASIGAAIFAALGRNPILGAVAGYAAGHGGFTANLMVAGTDGLLAGITESACKSMGIEAPTHPLINWFFMIVATFVIAASVTFVTEKIMPKFIKLEGDVDASELKKQELTPIENKGLKNALIAFVVFLVLILIFTIPQNGLLRNEAGNILPKSPFTKGIVAILFFLFVTLGTAYGIGAKVIKNHKSIPKFMANGLKGSISFFVVALPAAYFIGFFKASNLATIIAVKGANLLQSLNFSGIPLAISFVILTGFLNLFLTSGSSKWLILAPIFVPMFSIMNFSPALTQLAYRIGDSVTNPISPINYFLPMLIAILQQYKGDNEDIGIGTVISMTLPYSIMFLISLVLLLVIWMLIGLPLGPGTPLWL
ncbi:MAG: AbgT family transporter [Firmicutes bacterium]|nr:AbgT family transporter [Bacillota bacterium]